MSKEMLVIALGVLLVVQTQFGIPDSWHTTLVVVLGVAIFVRVPSDPAVPNFKLTKPVDVGLVVPLPRKVGERSLSLNSCAMASPIIARCVL